MNRLARVETSAQEMIVEVRGHRVLLDNDLARLFGVTTTALNQAVKRNRKRFPSDFMFQLTKRDVAALVSQSVISKGGRGGRRSPPFAFTEQGVAMLSSVLRSERAIQVNIEIMRAFVMLRRAAISHAGLSARIDALEERYDDTLQEIFDALRDLLKPSRSAKPPIGFGVEK